MLVSTKGRYALRVMIDLAEHQSDGFIPLKIIAQRQEISEKYLENIIKLLVKAKLDRMPAESRKKFSETLERLINEGNGGMICIIL